MSIKFLEYGVLKLELVDLRVEGLLGLRLQGDFQEMGIQDVVSLEGHRVIVYLGASSQLDI